MLDFYKISDDTPKPDWPEKIGMVRIDGLELSDFEDLKKRNLISEKFDFWSDFRLSKDSTLGLYDLILATYPEVREGELKIKAVSKLFKIVSSATKDNFGLIAYCD
ncbi:MAG: hypothetical protein MI866_04455 [Bacteroidales bacterium]|nr:hypothetical protein [Bacteroidales bacterium]